MYSMVFRLYHAHSGDCFIGSGLLDPQPFHQPTILLRSQLLHIGLISGPQKLTMFLSFIQQQKASSFPAQRLKSVSPPSTEQKQCFLEWSHVELCFHNGSQSIDPSAEIRVATSQVYWAIAGKVV